MRAQWQAAALAMVIALLGLGCGGSGSATGLTGPTKPKPVASVQVSPSPDTLTMGATVQLTAVWKASDGSTVAGQIVTWTTSNAAVATVSGAGVATGKGAGTATITATSENVNGTATVVVKVATTGGGGGVVRTWIGGATGPTDWSVAGNWQPTGVPSARDTARVVQRPNQAVLSANVQIAQLVIAGGTLRNAGHVLTIGSR